MTKPDPRNDDSLRGRHAVVTGASRGIGASIAAALARRGADVTLMSRDAMRLAAQAAELAATFNVEAEAVAVDIADAAQITAAFRARPSGSGRRISSSTMPARRWRRRSARPIRQIGSACWTSI